MRTHHAARGSRHLLEATAAIHASYSSAMYSTPRFLSLRCKRMRRRRTMRKLRCQATKASPRRGRAESTSMPMPQVYHVRAMTGSPLTTHNSPDHPLVSCPTKLPAIATPDSGRRGQGDSASVAQRPRTVQARALSRCLGCPCVAICTLSQAGAARQARGACAGKGRKRPDSTLCRPFAHGHGIPFGPSHACTRCQRLTAAARRPA